MLKISHLLLLNKLALCVNVFILAFPIPMDSTPFGELTICYFYNYSFS